MDCYFCIVRMTAGSVADLCVIDAGDDGEAQGKTRQLAVDWPVTATLSLYYGERLIDVMNGDVRTAA